MAHRPGKGNIVNQEAVMSFEAGGCFGHNQNEGKGQTDTMLPSSSSCALMKKF